MTAASTQPPSDRSEARSPPHMRFGANLSLFDSLDEGVIAIAADARIVYANGSAERMFRFGLGDLPGRPIDDLIPEALRHRHRHHVESFRRSAAHGRTMSERSGIKGRRKDGSLFDAEASIARIAVDDGDLLVAILRDVSHRKAVEAQLLASEQKHRAILETCTDAILLADAETGRIIEVNQRAADLFGCRIVDLLGIHQSELHPPADRERLTRTFREHIEIGRVLVSDATILRLDGRVVPVEIAARPTRLGGVLTLVGFFRDISHRERHERELVEAREEALSATRSKTVFLANVSHELRTPLNAIIAFSEMIGGEIFGPAGHPKYVEYAHDIRDSGNHLLEIINDILDISRVEMGKVELQEVELDLTGLIESSRRTVRKLIEETGLTCTAAIDPAASRLFGDYRAIRQMLLNLLSNAIRHTPKDGRIAIATGLTANGDLALSVSDTGCGIEPDRLATVTTLFNSSQLTTTNSPGGTGLGLAITKGLVTLHGGRFEIESQPGQGTTVRLVFPADRVRSGSRPPD